MKKNKISEEQITAVLSAFKEALEQGPWATSALLRVIGKKLQNIHDAFETNVGLEKKVISKKEDEHHSKKKPSETQQEVFVALYSSDGANIKSWEQILINLPRQMVSRPIYAEEEDIKRAIRERGKPINEGYVVIYVDQTNILSMPTDRTPKDRLGTALLTLKDKSLQADQIVCFVHVSGVYTYTRGRLIKDLSVDTDS
ncbi:MAG: Dot/Icm secretion system protein IcmQ [Gammaproteobacteria bacterium]|nr:Dot/Icm secretion system protein IcmQ [Gammaproteobacteria bacterium]